MKDNEAEQQKEDTRVDTTGNSSDSRTASETQTTPATVPPDVTQSFDGSVWAAAFVEHVTANLGIATDSIRSVRAGEYAAMSLAQVGAHEGAIAVKDNEAEQQNEDTRVDTTGNSSDSRTASQTQTTPATVPLDVTQSSDASAWAPAFVEHVTANPKIATDEGIQMKTSTSVDATTTPVHATTEHIDAATEPDASGTVLDQFTFEPSAQKRFAQHPSFGRRTKTMMEHIEATTEPDASRTVLDQVAFDETSAQKRFAQHPSFRRRTKTMIVCAVMCGGAALGASTLVWPRATAKEAGTGSLTVQSEPADATVFVDGNARGMTPVSVALAAGKHQLVLRRGQRSQEFSVTIAENVSTVHHVAWPPDIQGGALQVISDGARGTVTLDGVERGTTPLTIRDLSTGDHDVVFRSNGQVQQRTIRVEAGATASLVIGPVIPERGVESGWLVVSTDAPLQILEGGKLVGSSESERIMLPAGEHTFAFVSSALGLTVPRTVTIPANRTVTVPIPLPTAAISVNATPWAQVWLDGQSIGDTPIGNLTTKVGSHELIFRHPQFGEKRVTTLVTLKEPARVAVDMRRPQ